MSTSNHNPIPTPTESRHAGAVYSPDEINLVLTLRKIAERNPGMVQSIRKLAEAARFVPDTDWPAIHARFDAAMIAGNGSEVLARIATDYMQFEGVEDYYRFFDLDSLYDLDLLDTRHECSRLAVPDSEQSIWVCDECLSLVHDPDAEPPCSCRDEVDEDEEDAE